MSDYRTKMLAALQAYYWRRFRREASGDSILRRDLDAVGARRLAVAKTEQLTAMGRMILARHA